MRYISISSPTIDMSTKKLIREAYDCYDQGDFLTAYNIFHSIYENGQQIEGLLLTISDCLLKLNQKRKAKLFAFQELLDFPENHNALKKLREVNLQINGRTMMKSFEKVNCPEKYPSISLVLIVKNEEKDLSRCLESFKDIVKEIIIVDTGSTDRTVEIAKSYGARVEYFKWNDDFSAARNESLKYATCEWILRTDADEYIEDEEKGKLIACINSGVADVYICPTISSIKEGEQITENVRLIKNNKGIQFNYPIHETVSLSVNKLGLMQCITNVNFRHTGYEFDETGSQEKKIRRNIDVCEKYLVDNPSDFYVHLIHALFLTNTSRKEEGVNEIEQTLKNIPDDTISVRYLGLSYLVLVKKYITQKDDENLLKTLINLETDFCTFPTLMQYVGEILYFNQGDWKQAGKLFNWCTREQSRTQTYSDVLKPEKYNQSKSMALFADALVLNKEYEKAKQFYSESIKISEDTEDKFIITSAEDLRKNAKEWREKKEWLKAYNAELRAAAKSSLEFQNYLDLTNCQINLNNLKFAQKILDEANLINPNSPYVKNFESLIAIKEKDNEKGLEKAVEAYILDPRNKIFQNNIEQVANLLQLTPVQALKKVGLQWIESNKLKEGLFTLSIYIKFNPGDLEIKQIIEN